MSGYDKWNSANFAETEYPYVENPSKPGPGTTAQMNTKPVDAQAYYYATAAAQYAAYQAIKGNGAPTYMPPPPPPTVATPEVKPQAYQPAAPPPTEASTYHYYGYNSNDPSNQYNQYNQNNWSATQAQTDWSANQTPTDWTANQTPTDWTANQTSTDWTANQRPPQDTYNPAGQSYQYAKPYTEPIPQQGQMQHQMQQNFGQPNVQQLKEPEKLFRNMEPQQFRQQEPPHFQKNDSHDPFRNQSFQNKPPMGGKRERRQSPGFRDRKRNRKGWSRERDRSPPPFGRGPFRDRSPKRRRTPSGMPPPSLLDIEVQPTKNFPSRFVDDDKTIVRSADDEKSFYCTSCKVYIKHGGDIQQHLRGKRHRSNLKPDGPSDEKKDAEETVVTPTEESMEDKDSTDTATQDASSKILTDKDVTVDTTLTLIPHEDPARSRFFCFVCRLALLTAENVMCHEATVNHRKILVEIDKMAETKKDTQSVCLHCSCLYDKDKKEEHDKSEAHINNLHWRLAPCEICSVKFNTIANLESHFDHSKHNKMVSKMRRVGLDRDSLVGYYDELLKLQEERRSSYCLLCTTVCGSAENMELHNVVAADVHRRKKIDALKATGQQFYCYCCEKIIDEQDRRHHGKSQSHRNNRDKKKRWICEDCLEDFKDEPALVSHLSSRKHNAQVKKRQKLMAWSETLYKEKLAVQFVDAKNHIIEQVCSSIEAGTLPKQTADFDTPVLPVAGDFCTVCKIFFLFNTNAESLCMHVLETKGLKNKEADCENVDLLASRTDAEEQYDLNEESHAAHLSDHHESYSDLDEGHNSQEILKSQTTEHVGQVLTEMEASSEAHNPSAVQTAVTIADGLLSHQQMNGTPQNEQPIEVEQIVKQPNEEEPKAEQELEIPHPSVEPC